MVIIFVLVLIVGFILIKGSASEVMTQNRRCQGKHKWVTRQIKDDRLHYLVCADCGQIPGEE